MNRLFLYSGFLFILILIFDAYDRDYNQPQIENSRSNSGQSFDQNANQPPKGDVQNEMPEEDDEIRQEDIRSIEHQKLLISYNTKSGDLLFSKLKDYPLNLGSEENVVILDHESKRYTAASKIQIKDQSMAAIYKPTDGSTDSIKLLSNNIPEILLEKEIKLVKDSHQIIVSNSITNNGKNDIYVRNYEIISRDGNNTASLMLPTYTGSAYYDSDDKFSKISFDDMLESEQTINAQDSWISMIEHYFSLLGFQQHQQPKQFIQIMRTAYLPSEAQHRTKLLDRGKSMILNQLCLLGPNYNQKFLH